MCFGNKLYLTPKTFSGSVNAYPSKSISHRALFLAAQSRKKIKLYNLSLCRDVRYTVKVLQKTGVCIRKKGDFFLINKRKDKKNVIFPLYCGSSGSTARFLIPYLLSLGIKATVTGSKQLKNRPLDEFKTIYGQQNLIENTALPMRLTGKNSVGGKYCFNGKISSQFTTGLMMAAPLMKEESTLYVPTDSVSYPYINLTASVMDEFGFKIKEQEGVWLIPGQQAPVCTEYTVEGDWSLAAFWLCLGAVLCPDGLTVNGLQVNSSQGDKAILDIILSLGIKAEVGHRQVTVFATAVEGEHRLNLIDNPDLFPVLCAFAALTEGKFYFDGLSTLKYKESNRLYSVCSSLKTLGVDIAVNQGSVTVDGKSSRFISAPIADFQDHRVTFACALWALGSREYYCLDGLNSVCKSWPTFTKELRTLGLARKR